MSSAEYLCVICLGNYAIADLRSLPCGHAICAPCIESYKTPKRDEYICPCCSAPFEADQPHRMFLVNGDPETQDATESSIRTVCHTRAFHLTVASAIREVRSVQDGRGTHTVQRAAETLEKVAGLEDGGDCLLGLLLSTVAGNWRGMLPLFSTNAAQVEKIEDLRAQLKEAKSNITKAEQTADKALGASEQLPPTLQETNSRLATLEQDIVRQSERHMAELAQRNEAMKTLHDQSHVLEARERKHNAMMQQLRQETKAQAQIAAPQRHSADALNTEDSELRVLSLSPDPLHVGLRTSRTVTPLTRKSVDDEDTCLVDEPEVPSTPAGKRKRSVDEDETAPSHAAMDDPIPTSSWRAPLGRKFSSDWNIPSQQSRRAGSSSKPQQSSAPAIHALDIDKSGKSNKLVRLGSRRSM